MPETHDGYSRSRDRSPSGSPAPEHDRHRRRRPRDDERGSRSRHHDSHRSSRRDDTRRRSSRSPAERGSHRRDHKRQYRDRGEGEKETPEDDRKRSRHSSHQKSAHRRHRDRDSCDRKASSARRRHDDSRSRSRSRSRSPNRRSRSPDSRAPVRSRQPLPPQQDSYTSSQMAQTGDSGGPPPPEKEKPNFAQTGRLAAESKTVDINGSAVVLKYHEPPEARKPPTKEPWRLYVFKGKDLLEMVELNIRSCWLIGREQLVVDFPLEHPSCSKQHAALQFRFVEKRNEFGDRIGRVKPYAIDLESANGTTVNGSAIPAGRYVELRDKDVLQFGLSSREYVLMLPQPE
ncbi:SMAD/FHA domain-containing protein [Aspergillus ellipticus CBS 707.79]|uniref:SMAD/FHA domain-containing protein n=1 Tax=Aspergillus ellipticus CBS 707.79 TaxID=1448320 RepID=A0A319DNP8_9EURO|nr:SMAD/FHA domain-containing protein [Aspergillus ellipticus CBS 707.79]